jgi:hypothetical protein
VQEHHRRPGAEPVTGQFEPVNAHRQRSQLQAGSREGRVPWCAPQITPQQALTWNRLSFQLSKDPAQ